VALRDLQCVEGGVVREAGGGALGRHQGIAIGVGIEAGGVVVPGDGVHRRRGAQLQQARRDLVDALPLTLREVPGDGVGEQGVREAELSLARRIAHDDAGAARFIERRGDLLLRGVGGRQEQLEVEGGAEDCGGGEDQPRRGREPLQPPFEDEGDAGRERPRR
jgi:hypothetical protein